MEALIACDYCLIMQYLKLTDFFLICALTIFWATTDNCFTGFFMQKINKNE